MIASMAYILELPPSSNVRLIFHVSFLKKVIGKNIWIWNNLQDNNEEVKIILEPKTILKTRIKKLEIWAIIEYLIQWKNLQVAEATWEANFFMQNTTNGQVLRKTLVWKGDAC